ncbi:MAG: hypothetical protein ACRDRS_13560 [Pseudonocardiaceae bacterium]
MPGGDEVELACAAANTCAAGGVEELVGELGDAASEPGDDLRAQRRTDHPAQLLVAWRVGRDEVAHAEFPPRLDHPGRVGGEHPRVGEHPRHVAPR